MRLYLVIAAWLIVQVGLASAQGLAAPHVVLEGFVPTARPAGPLFSLTGRGPLLFSVAPPGPLPALPDASLPGTQSPKPASTAMPRFSPSSLAARPVSIGIQTGLATPGGQCREAIQAAERAAGIPEDLMAAIGRVESGRRDTDGTVSPWPWSINVEGVDHVYETKAEAVAAVADQQARGVRSIDVGCMQVNLMYHPDAFATLEQAFDPVANAAYAARFLTELYKQTGSWDQATAWYHSATPGLGAEYQRKVYAVLPVEQQRRAAARELLSAGGPRLAGAKPPAVGTSGGATLPATTGAFATGALPAGGGYMLSNNASAARIIPLAAGTIGRALAAYRLTPVMVSARQAQRQIQKQPS